MRLTGMRRRETRRLFIVSLVAHAGLFLALGWSPGGRIVAPAGVIAVDLVAAPSAVAPAAKPAPAPAPAPKPKPAPKKVVLPEKPRTDPTRPKKVAKKVPAPVAPAPEEDLDDVMAKLRAEAGENRETEPAEAAPAALPAGSPDGRPVSPEVLSWMRKAKLHVRRNWVVPPGFRTQPLETHVLVELDAGGGVIGTPRVTKRSGNPWYDEGVTRAIEKASPLPAPPESGEWSFVFVPADSF